VFDCTCNTQNSLLLSQHNGDDAPQYTASIFRPHVYLENDCSKFLRKRCNIQPNCREEYNHNFHRRTAVQYDKRTFFVRYVEVCNCKAQLMFTEGCVVCLTISYNLHIIFESAVPTEYTENFQQIRDAAAATE